MTANVQASSEGANTRFVLTTVAAGVATAAAQAQHARVTSRSRLASVLVALLVASGCAGPSARESSAGDAGVDTVDSRGVPSHAPDCVGSDFGAPCVSATPDAEGGALPPSSADAVTDSSSFSFEVAVGVDALQPTGLDGLPTLLDGADSSGGGSDGSGFARQSPSSGVSCACWPTGDECDLFFDKDSGAGPETAPPCPPDEICIGDTFKAGSCRKACEHPIVKGNDGLHCSSGEECRPLSLLNWEREVLEKIAFCAPLPSGPDGGGDDDSNP